MIPFCTVKLAYHNYQAAILNLCFIGTSIITPVFVGWFADVCVERKKLIYMCLLLHFLGTALLPVVASPLGNFYIGSHRMINNIPEKKTRLFYVALLTICLGTGGIRAIVCPLDLRFYWISNLSATVVLLGRSYIQHSGAWALVLLIPFMSTLMALITLHMVHYNLIYQPEKCCSLLTTSGVFVNALKMFCLRLLHEDLTNRLDHAKEEKWQLLQILLVIGTAQETWGTHSPWPPIREALLHSVVFITIMIFISISIMSYRFVPSTVRGNLTNFLILFNGFVYFMGELLVELVYLISEGNWFPNTLNKGYLESFFFFLASLTLLNTLGFWSVSQRYYILNHFNAQNINGSNLEETLLLREKSLKFYGSAQEFSSSIDLWETAL